MNLILLDKLLFYQINSQWKFPIKYNARVGLLNFASVRNRGGEFINGAKAHLARCLGLYSCLLKQPLYYQANRTQDSLLYTNYVIYPNGLQHPHHAFI
ncbi:MAG: TIGR02452 family protein [Acidobacteriota bacterium]